MQSNSPPAKLLFALGEERADALAKGETKTVTFDKPGIYYYICTPHPWMYGRIIVE